MKLQLLSAGILTAIALQASATIVNLAGGPGGMTFVDNAGNPLPNGNIVEIGRLDAGDIFVNFADGAIATVFGNAGKWAGTAADNTATADAFNGKLIWGRITAPDGAVAVFSSGDAAWKFPVNAGGVGDTSNPNSINIDVVNSTLSTPGFTVDGGTFTFGVIPEPSSTFLFGAAGLALLIRRKR